MRLGLLVALALVLLGCPRTPWCDRLNPDQSDGLSTCVYATTLARDAARPIDAASGAPLSFHVGIPNDHPDQAEQTDGTRLTGQPWGVTWTDSAGALIRTDSVGAVVAHVVSADASRYVLALRDGRVVARTADHETMLAGRAVEASGPDGPNAMMSLALSLDGTLLVTGDQQRNVDLWAPGSGGHRWHATLDGDTRSLAISSDGRYVATASHAGTVTVRDAASGASVATWVHPQAVAWVGFTDDGAHLVVRIRQPWARNAAAFDPDEVPASGGIDRPDVVAVWCLP
ncbi:WD40 repeat domain-containing protein [Rubrivirga sp. IMCC43871]|uniref:WD40 repeat domain-containing protein n=1 Tax=Rubrivirga sp. IMCC43871 TaxID=3391575 RepID=UPI00399038A5